MGDPPAQANRTQGQEFANTEFESQVQLGKAGSQAYWRGYFQSSRLDTFKAQAYGNPDGLAVRTNRVTGNKELFIAGSRDFMDWEQNIQETLYSGFEDIKGALNLQGAIDKGELLLQGEIGEALDAEGAVAVDELEKLLYTSVEARDQFARYIDGIIRDEGVTVVYAHSRGAAIASALESDVVIVGLDGAMGIAHEDADFLNIRQPLDQGYAFDTLLAGDYENTFEFENRAFHDVTLEKGAEKPRAPTPTPRARARVEKRKKKSSFWVKAGKVIRVFDVVDPMSQRGPNRPARRMRISKKHLSDRVTDMNDDETVKMSNKKITYKNGRFTHVPVVHRRKRSQTSRVSGNGKKKKKRRKTKYYDA